MVHNYIAKTFLPKTRRLQALSANSQEEQPSPK